MNTSTKIRSTAGLKLGLHRQTLRTLTITELRQIAGGPNGGTGNTAKSGPSGI